MTVIATIGHSTHTIEYLVSLLTRNSVTAVADVRSSPFSRRNPQFNRDSLKRALKVAGVSYAFLGEELGARSSDPAHYVDEQVSYERLATSEAFQAGIDRVLSGARTHRIALLCAEKDPVTCHRTILVARALVERGAVVEHILADGSIESHDAAMERLMTSLGIGSSDLFSPPDGLRDRAYHEQAARIAYVSPEADVAA